MICHKCKKTAEQLMKEKKGLIHLKKKGHWICEDCAKKRRFKR